MDSFIPYGRQFLTEEDIESVVSVLKSDFLTQGPQIPIFEDAITNYCKVQHATAVNSATSALHISCLALGMCESSLVWTSPNSFVASANCALYCGASVDFVDICDNTYNMCMDALDKKLRHAQEHKLALPDLIIPVHFAGQSCDMKTLAKLAQEFGFSVIEDASHCIGGKYFDKPIGSCKYSDITVFSFHPVKIITTGEGGIATTNNTELWEKLNRLRSHGIDKIDKQTLLAFDPAWIYEQHELGFNYRITDVQAVLGTSQLNRVDELIDHRHMLADRYDSKLMELGIVLPHRNTDTYSALHLYPILVPNTADREQSRKKLFEEFRKNNIGVNVHYIPIHTQPYYQEIGFKVGDFPIAENYYSRTISLPIYGTMSTTQQDTVIDVLKRSLADIIRTEI